MGGYRTASGDRNDPAFWDSYISMERHRGNFRGTWHAAHFALAMESTDAQHVDAWAWALEKWVEDESPPRSDVQAAIDLTVSSMAHGVTSRDGSVWTALRAWLRANGFTEFGAST